MPVGWNWKNSMSSSGTPRRNAAAGPSPVKLSALLVILYMRPQPPVAKSTAFAWKMWMSPRARHMATTPQQTPSRTSRSSRKYSSKNVTPFRMHCW